MQKFGGIQWKTLKRVGRSVAFGLGSASAFPLFLLLLLLFFGAADAVGDIGVAVVGILRGFVIGDI